MADTGRDIVPGDFLISSDIPGHAMLDDRAADVSFVMGRAGEAVTWIDVQETVGGVRHKEISILFNAFVRDNRESSERMDRLEAWVEDLQHAIRRLQEKQ